MATLESHLQSLITAIGADIKDLQDANPGFVTWDDGSEPGDLSVYPDGTWYGVKEV